MLAENTTGKYSYYTTFRGYEIMFHVNTLLPYFPLDPQQLERKRHVGNDVGVIIFTEGADPISIQSFTSELNRTLSHCSYSSTNHWLQMSLLSCTQRLPRRQRVAHGIACRSV